MFSIEILVICLLILINSIFSCYELALISISAGRLKHLADKKVKGAHAALKMRTRSEASLAVIQIGITFVGAVSAAVGGAEAASRVIPYIEHISNFPLWMIKIISITAVVIPISVLTIIIGELVPKTIGLRYNEKICLMLSPSINIFSKIVFPAMLFFEWATKRIVRIFERNIEICASDELGVVELRAQARALTANKIINPFQERLIIGVSNLSKIKLKDILIPIDEVVTLYVNGNLEEHFVKLHLEPYTRFPVVEIKGDAQSIIGYANIKEIIFLAKTHPESPTLREILRPIISFSTHMSIGEAFTAMMREHIHLAIVRDKHENIIGMVTLEDILEEVTGDIEDEFDKLPKHITTSGKQYLIGGGVKIGVLAAKINELEMLKNLDKTDINFSEWVKNSADIKKLNGGDNFNIGRYNILIRKVRRNQILEAMLSIT